MRKTNLSYKGEKGKEELIHLENLKSKPTLFNVFKKRTCAESIVQIAVKVLSNEICYLIFCHKSLKRDCLRIETCHKLERKKNGWIIAGKRFI